MAIEFNCPYCTSQIRVNDTAAGKRGRCPRCDKQLLVPNVEIPPSPVQPVATPQTPATPVTQLSPPAVPIAPDHSQPMFPQQAPFVATAQPAARTKRRRRRSSTGLVLGILSVCAIAIVGLIAVLYIKDQPVVLEGALTGEIVGSEIRSATIPGTDSGLTADRLEVVTAALRETPYSMKSSVVVTEIRGTDGGFEVRFIPSPAAKLVRVNPDENAAFAGWLAKHREKLIGKRTNDLKAAVAKFFDAYAASTEGGASVGNACLLYTSPSPRD